MRVLLIQPPASRRAGLRSFIMVEPLGLETVAATLLPEHEVEIVDARLEPAIRRLVSSFQPDAVGVTVQFTSGVYNAYGILEVVREHNPKIRTFVGGHHASLCPDDFAGRADAVVIGEGEMTARELLRAWETGGNLREVAGIAFQDGDAWSQTAPRPLIENLDDMPLPARHLTHKYWDRYYQGRWRSCAWVETSRGCPYRCKFCSVWKFHRGRFRARGPERVVEEVRQLAAANVVFSDDNFLADASRAARICQLIRARHIRKSFEMEARADAIVRHPELVKEWRDIGLGNVVIGFEAVTQEALDAINKHTSVKHNEEAISILKRLGINALCSFIVDTAFKEEDFVRLRDYIKRFRPPFPTFSVLTPLPGTELWEAWRSRLITQNYDLFDIQHAVVAPYLGLRRFYQEYARLYRSIYLNRHLPRLLFDTLWTGSPFTFLQRAWAVLGLLRRVVDSDALLKDYRFHP